jgi:putative peptidoglycan lipid II flippase
VALAISSTGSAFVNAGLLYWHLHRQNVFRFESHWKKIIGQYMVANGAMVISLLAALNLYQAHVSQWLRIIELLGLCALGAGVFGVVLLLTGFRPRHLQHD